MHPAGTQALSAMTCSPGCITTHTRQQQSITTISLSARVMLFVGRRALMLRLPGSKSLDTPGMLLAASGLWRGHVPVSRLHCILLNQADGWDKGAAPGEQDTGHCMSAPAALMTYRSSLYRSYIPCHTQLLLCHMKEQCIAPACCTRLPHIQCHHNGVSRAQPAVKSPQEQSTGRGQQTAES